MLLLVTSSSTWRTIAAFTWHATRLRTLQILSIADSSSIVVPSTSLTILQSNLKNADLAFLSACQTSTGEEKLSDEAVHLAAGMLAAGYRRVVATMWSIGDQPAQEVANTFYEYLWSHRKGDSGGAFDGTLSAYALHHAVQQLRHRLDNSESSLLTWVPYVHFGY